MSGDLTVGIRLKADGSGLVGEVKLSRQELKKLGVEAETAGKKAQSGAKGVDRFGDEAKSTSQEARKLNKQLKNTGQSFNMLASIVGGFSLGLLSRDVFDTALAFDRIESALTAAMGTTEAAAREFQFIERQTERLGLELISTADQYAKLANATKGSSLEGAATRDVFIAISEASAVLRLSTSQTEGAFRALPQMISKGTVSAEEIRTQLGEHVYGAFLKAAKAVGVTTQEFGKMLERGEVIAEDFIPKLSRVFHDEMKDKIPGVVDSATYKIVSFNNALTQLKLAFSGGGFLDGVADGLKSISGVLSTPEMKEFLSKSGAFVGDAMDLAAREFSWKNLIPGVAPYKLYQHYTDDRPRVSQWLPQRGDSGFSGAGGNGQGGGKDGPPQKVTDHITSLTAEHQQLVALRTAYGEGAEAIQLVNDAREVHNTLLQLGLNVEDAEGQRIRDLIVGNLELEREIRALSDAEKDRVKHLEDIKAEHDKLPKSYQEMEAAAYQWRTEALAGLDMTKAGYNEFAIMVEEIFAERMKDAYRTHLDNSREWQAGAIRFLDGYAESAADAASQMETVFGNAFDKLEDDILRGKASFGDFINSMAMDLARLTLRQGILGPLANAASSALGSWWDGFGGGYTGPNMSSAYTDAWGVGVGHEGGMFGGPNAFDSRSVSPSLFTGAPRFHGGGQIGPDEYPLIAKKGEIIGWPNQLRHAFGGTNVSVIVNDHRTGGGDAGGDIQVSQRNFGEEQVIEMMIPGLNHAISEGRLDGSLAGRYHLQPGIMPGS